MATRPQDKDVQGPLSRDRGAPSTRACCEEEGRGASGRSQGPAPRSARGAGAPGPSCLDRKRGRGCRPSCCPPGTQPARHGIRFPRRSGGPFRCRSTGPSCPFFRMLRLPAAVRSGGRASRGGGGCPACSGRIRPFGERWPERVEPAPDAGYPQAPLCFNVFYIVFLDSRVPLST